MVGNCGVGRMRERAFGREKEIVQTQNSDEELRPKGEKTD